MDNIVDGTVIDDETLATLNKKKLALQLVVTGAVIVGVAYASHKFKSAYRNRNAETIEA